MRTRLQKLGEFVHTQRFREKSRSQADDLHQCLEKMQDWPTAVLQAARGYYDIEGAGYWSRFIAGGGPFQHSSECTFTEHVKPKNTSWPLHEAFRVSGIAGGCLIAAAFREKSQVLPPASATVGQASEPPHLILGLAAASGDCSALGYANVPELADYKIRKYDGKERVVW